MSNKNLLDIYSDSKKEFWSNIRFVLIVVVFLLVFLYLRNCVFMVICVKGTSMCNTLHDGDLLFAIQTQNVDRGDVVIIKDDDISKDTIIKRVIATGGDTVWSEDGYVYISFTDDYGKTVTTKLDENYVFTSGITNILERFTVPTGCVFVLGDNRAVSSDSRTFGPVKKSSIVGVVPNWSINIKDTGFVDWCKKIYNSN